jgi:hypothetical protein
MRDARNKDAAGVLRSLWAEKKLKEQKKSAGQDPITIDTYMGKTTLTGSQDHINIPSKLSSCGHPPVINLTIMCEGFRGHQPLDAVLWTLMQKGKVTLNQNVHIYHDIPDKYGKNFNWPPLRYSDNIGTIAKRSKHLRLYILADRESRIIVKSSNDILRVFGNIWQSKDQRIVLKGMIPPPHELLGCALIFLSDFAGVLEAADAVVHYLQRGSTEELELMTADLKPLINAVSHTGNENIYIEKETVRQLVVGSITDECTC